MTPEQRVAPDRSGDNNAITIIEHPSLLLPTIRSGEQYDGNGNRNISSRYDAPIDYNIAQAWIASAPEHQNHSTTTSNEANDDTEKVGLEGFQDEYTESGRSITPLKDLRRNLFSRSGAEYEAKDSSAKSNLAWNGDEHHQYEDPIHQDIGEPSGGGSRPSTPPLSLPGTPPSIPEDLMGLSNNSGNQEANEHVQHSYGQNPIRISDENEKKDDLANHHDANGSFKAVASPGENDQTPFLWIRSPQDQIPDEIVLDDDQQANMEDELLTGDGGENCIMKQKLSSNPRLFRPPTLKSDRPSAIRAEDRQVTPQSWQTPISMLPRAMAYRNTSGGSSRRSAPLSPGSRRSTRSEKYYHSYHTNLGSTPKAVPPFVVVHKSGSAVVTVTPKRTTLVTKTKQKKSKKSKALDDSISDPLEAEEIMVPGGLEANCGCDGEEAKVWCRMWGRPVTIALCSAVFALALVTVVTSLVASRFQTKSPQQQQLRPRAPTFSPVVSPSTGSSNLVLDAGNENFTDEFLDGVVLRPYEGSQNPAEARPTLPPRTYPPSTYAEVEIPTFAPTMLPDNFPDYVPTMMPFSQESEVAANDHDFEQDEASLQIPWNNYVIGLLSVESPNTFSSFSDASSPQFLALQWISVDASRKGGSGAYTMDVSLQRFALATIFFALGGLDEWSDKDSWLSTVVPVCEWKGISCDSSNTVVLSLDLSSNNLSGTMPAELFLLKYLQVLDFSGNSITGSLPSEYSHLHDLVELNISGNLLTGSIPEEYGSAGNFEFLEVLDVSHNSIQGSLPAQLGNLQSLRTIQMCSNSMTGTIPSTLGSLNKLNSIKLCNNKFTGNLPGAMCETTPSTRVFDCTIECECCASCCADGEDCC